MMEYLSILVSGDNQATMASELTLLASKNQCSIEYGQMMNMGTVFTATLMYSGEWSGIAKIEAALPGLEKKLALSMIVKRTQQPTQQQSMLPYTAQVVGIDNATTVHELCNFFSKQGTVIFELNTAVSTSRQATSRIFNLIISLGIPATLSIANLREHYMVLCEELNVDGILEPDRR